jgi:hypothetical protein
MRVAYILLIALFLATPALAAQPAPGDAQHIFGSVTCPNRVPCPDTGETADASVANACIAQYFGYTSASGFFDTSGLNGNNCLTPLPNVLPKGVGNQLSPICCVIKLPQDGTCAFHCDLATQN